MVYDGAGGDGADGIGVLMEGGEDDVNVEVSTDTRGAMFAASSISGYAMLLTTFRGSLTILGCVIGRAGGELSCVPLLYIVIQEDVEDGADA